MRAFVESLLDHPRFGSQVVHREYLPPTPARFAPTASALPGLLEDGLAARGIERLWDHQARALDAVRSGRSTLVVTPTASGKSLVFRLPTLEAFLDDPDARALYLFPYKALARDQLEGLRELADTAVPLRDFRAAVYDGDTPDARRRKLRRDPPHALLTNPDMLHLGILAHHTSWAGFLSRLRLVVLDEAHVYRGIFGTHVHHVLQRLRRLAALHGSDPTFVACSATVGDPGGFAESLVGVPFEVIEGSGAPRGGRHLVCLNPVASSPYTVAVELFAEIVAAGHKTIAFTKARRITELIHFWLTRSHPDLAARTAAYRAGYLPEERRRIERRLFSGELDGVIATSALEHGIDVGGLDACLLVGYPGSVASTWQRMGRAGRGTRDALTVLIALPDALDQYVVSHPATVTEGTAERVVFDPDNETIARAHLVCAGAESPILPDDLSRFPPANPERIQALAAEGHLVRDHEAERWYALRRRPHREVNLRAAGQPYAVIEAAGGRSVGSLEAGRAFMEGHAGAIYLHAGVTWQVLDLDLEARRVLVEAANVDYFTSPYSEKETEILETCEQRSVGPVSASLGRVKVTVQVREYGRRRIADQQEISRHPLDLPPVVFETVGLWLTLPESLNPMLTGREHHFLGSLHATEHAAIGLFPLLAICDRGDLGGISYAFNPQLEAPAIFVYDGIPGGVGLARTGYRRLEELLGHTRARLEVCPCEEGCPGCVQSPRCGSGNRPLDKSGALLLLDVLEGRRALEAASDDAIEKARTASLATHRAHPHRGTHAAPLAAAPTAVAPTVVASADGAASSSAASRASPDSSSPTGPDGIAPRAGSPAMDAVRLVLRPEEGRVVFFDLETLRSAEEVGGWGRIDAMGLALACVYDAATDRHTVYLEREADRLLLDLMSADLVVGFNVDRFDLRVLEPYAPAGLSRIRTLDLLARVHETLGFRLSLGHLAVETLGEPKSADGLQSLQWMREGRVDEVADYCCQDVELTARLFAHGREHGYLIYRNRDERKVRLPVSW